MKNQLLERVVIVQKEASVLRDIATEVPAEMFGTPKLRKILKQMKTALDSQHDGVAIAAPQIGESLRIFIISKKVQDMISKTKTENKEHADIVCINPKIIRQSKERKMMDEGCLSCRYLYGKVSRATKATLEAYDELGNFMHISASGLIAQIFQHECDHLEGILFIDKAVKLRDIPPEDYAHE